MIEAHAPKEVKYHGTTIVHIIDLQGNQHVTRTNTYYFSIQVGKTE